MAPRSRMVGTTHRRCADCGEVKLVAEFSRRKRSDRPTGRLYYMAYCKPCAAERNSRRLYGATLGEMTEHQGSDVCPLCLVRKADSLDHDHATGKPRGALCRK